jgi:hypothetical protein
MPRKSIYGTPGVLTHARARRVQAVLLAYFAYCIVSAVFIWILVSGPLATVIWLLATVGPVVAYGWRRSIGDLLRPVVAEYSGRDALASELGPLAHRGYTVRHDVDLGRGSVDVLVVGPSGIYAIECSAWPGRFAIKNGRLTRSGVSAERLLARTVAAAELVSRRLAASGVDAAVTPVLALTRSTGTEGMISLRGAHVVRAPDLALWIHRRPVKLETLTIDRARDALG